MSINPLPSDPPAYWFHAKRFGWCWGWPARWQGWVVVAVWLASVVAGGVLIAPQHLGLYFPFMVVMAALFIGVCYLTGEPPRWRW